MLVDCTHSWRPRWARWGPWPTWWPPRGSGRWGPGSGRRARTGCWRCAPRGCGPSGSGAAGTRSCAPCAPRGSALCSLKPRQRVIKDFAIINPLLSNGNYSYRIIKISLTKKGGIMQKNSYERRVYESVDLKIWQVKVSGSDGLKNCIW